MVEARKANFMYRTAMEFAKYAAIAGSLFSAGCVSEYTKFHSRLFTGDVKGAFKAPYENNSQLGTLNLVGILAVDAGLVFLMTSSLGGGDGERHEEAGPGPTPSDPF